MDHTKNPCYGATCGRVAGRIGKAQFKIGRNMHKLYANDGKACLHGGNMGWNRWNWDATII